MQALTAGIVNLVPEGLILLISLTAAVSAFKMARRGVLAQQLNAIESLASVDIVCTDKTGTLTEPSLRVVELVPAAGAERAGSWRRGLRRYAASAPSRNPTLEAIADAELADVAAEPVVAQVPFSSRRRWSALELGDERLVLGRAGALRRRRPGARGRARASRRAPGGGCWRSARTEAPLPADGRSPSFPDDVRPLGLVVLAERLRANAAETVAFFAAQEVALKVLSGDAPATVGAIARDAGIPGSAPALDGEALPTDPAALLDAVLAAPAVGRISPEGKRAVVAALADAGRYVAMVGDGVNDVPALKEARLAIAQGSGTQMARSVADLVLVRDDFARRAGHGRRGPADPAQHPARRPAVRHQGRVHRRRRARGRHPDRNLPAAAAPVHDRLHGHDRDPRLLARARAELRALAARALPPVGRPLRDPGRARHRHRHRRPATCSPATASTSA